MSMASPERKLCYADVNLDSQIPFTTLLLIVTKVGINLTDPVYRGVYHGKQAHEDDLTDVVKRGVDAGCKKLMITGSDLRNSEEGIRLAREHGEHHKVHSTLSLLMHQD